MDLWDDKEWTTRDGDTIALEDMTDSHRRNLISWLRRNAGVLKHAEEMAFVSGPMPSAETEAWSMVMGGVQEWLNEDPQEWLEETPLMIRLLELDRGGAG